MYVNTKLSGPIYADLTLYASCAAGSCTFCFPTDWLYTMYFWMQNFHEGYCYIPSTVPSSYKNICWSFLCNGDMTNAQQQGLLIRYKYFTVITNVSGIHLSQNYVCYIMDFKIFFFKLLNDMTSHSTHTNISSLWILRPWEILSSRLLPRTFCVIRSENILLSR